MQNAVAPEVMNFLHILHCTEVKVNLSETYKALTNHTKKSAYVLQYQAQDSSPEHLKSMLSVGFRDAVKQPGIYIDMVK